MLAKLFIFIITGTVLLSCNVKSSRTPASVGGPVTNYEKFISDTLTVKVLGEDGKDKLVSLTVSFVGKQGLEQEVKENKNLVSDLIRTSVSEYKFSDLRRDGVQNKFKEKVLESLNAFTSEKFIRVDVVELREI